MMRPIRSFAAVFYRSRVSVLALLLAASGAGGIGCGSSGSGAPTHIGNSGRNDNGVVSVDKQNLTGSIDGSTLTVNVPVTSLVTHATSGTLKLHLQSVDGATDFGSVDLPYTLAAGDHQTLTGSLQAPANIKTQSDYVLQSVRIDDGTTNGLRVIKSLLYVLPLTDLTVEGPSTLRAGREASYRVRAEDGFKHQPLSSQAVTLDLLQGDQVVQSKTVQTAAAGDSEVKFTVDAAGSFQVRAQLQSNGVPLELVDTVSATAATQKLLLTTDKPIYQPGQLINLRALALNQGDDTPSANAPVTFEVDDGKGNKLLKQPLTTDQFGVAATTFQLGNLVNEGTFKVRVISGSITTEKTVTVSHYALPKYDVEVKPQNSWYAPGSTVKGGIDSNYFFGKAVAGSVLVQAYSLDVGETLFTQVMGTLDGNGHFDFSLTLPSTLPGLPIGGGSAQIELRTTVTDSAGQQVQKSTLLTISAQGVVLSIVPESTDLVPGIENRLLVFATDPLGSPLPNTALSVNTPNQSTLQATTDAYGQAELAFTPNSASSNQTFQASAVLPDGTTASTSFTFGEQSGVGHLIVRTDKSVYQVGDTVNVTVLSTEDSGDLYVDWLNDGQAVDMRTLTASHGSATFSTTLDASLIGSNRINAYLVDDAGNVVRSGRTIFARTDAALNVSVSTDKDVYTPGAPAKLTLSVTDEAGNPKAAALGLQIVDEAVFSLVDAKPGLLRSYFELDDQLATPSYQISAPPSDLSELLFTDTASSDQQKQSAAQRQTQGALAAMKNQTLVGISHESLPAILQAATTELAPSLGALQTSLVPPLRASVALVLDELQLAGCSPTSGACPNGTFNQAFTERVNGISVYDFWGNPFKAQDNYYQLLLTGTGPDGQAGTQDDESLTFAYADLGVSSDTRDVTLPGINNVGASAGGGPLIAVGGSTATTSPTPDTGSSATPRVRTDFPETLYVNPSVITDASGKATVDVNMADSITQWRLSALASSSDGRLGGTDAGIKVFQDFFVDIDFPATLTRGDQVTFPIAVYNYLDTPQNVALELDAGTWYTPLGQTSTSVLVQPGQVVGVSFPVRVDEVGVRTLTVKAVGDQVSDAVARTVSIVPDGRAFPSAASGSFASGSVSQSISFPPNSIAGSQAMYVDIFPAFLAQVVQGMDSILSTPTGCFEQTTSSAWPNVLATSYMKATQQITPDIELKAAGLMSAGYQRLLTFEHTTGGYSWFGEQDPKATLSVTAFGLMEFSDMAQVQQVDDAMMKRTHDWLVAQQQPDGSFLGDNSEFFSFQTSTVRNTAFTAWSLASYGDTSSAVQNALAYVKANLGSDQDAYTLGLVANAYALAAPNDPELTTVLQALDASAKSDGKNVYWDTGDTQTPFYSAGLDAAVSATALVTYALLSTRWNAEEANGALAYLASKKDPNGNFGSTQATVWSLRAMILAAKNGTQGAVGSLSVNVDGTPNQTLALTSAQSDVMTRIDLSALATNGNHNVTLDFTGTGKVSYNLVSSYNLAWADAPSDAPGPLSINVSYDKTTLFVNDTINATVNVVNNEAVTENMVLVTLGIAPGFSVNTDALQQYLTSGAISKFEVTGQQLILYVTAMAPHATLSVTYPLQATMPVTAVDGGAEARLYYQPEQRAKSAAQMLTAQKQ